MLKKQTSGSTDLRSETSQAHFLIPPHATFMESLVHKRQAGAEPALSYYQLMVSYMNFNLKKPCKECPFSRDCRDGWLGEGRAEEIINSIAGQGQAFTCHKTDRDQSKEAEHCAGALILLEKADRPNQLMRISERLGFYDRFKLDFESNVFDDIDEFIDHHA